MPLLKAKSDSLFSNSFFIFIIRFFPSMANLVVLILYSRQLPQDTNGHYLHFWIQMNLIFPLACFGIHVLVITYSKDFIQLLFQQIKRRHYAAYALWVILLSLVFASLQANALHITFIVPFLFLLSFSLSAILESLLIVFRSYKVLTIVSILYSMAFCFVHLYVLKHGFSLQSLFLGLLVVVVVRLGIYCVVLRKALNQASRESSSPSFDLRTIRSLWLHLGLYDVLQVLFSWIDKFIISIILIAPVSAIYYNGSQTIPVLPLLLSAAGSAVLIQLAEANKEDEIQDIISSMNQSGRLLSCIVFPVFFYLFLFRAELFQVVLTDKYIPSIPVFAMSVLVLPVKAYSFTTVLQRLHKGAVINAGAVADLVLACVLMYPLYVWLGLPGVALSLVISTYLQAAFYLFWSAKLLKINPLRLIPYVNWLVKLIVFSFVLIVIHYAGNKYFTREISLILGGVVMAILISGSVFVEVQIQKKNGSY